MINIPEDQADTNDVTFTSVDLGTPTPEEEEVMPSALTDEEIAAKLISYDRMKEIYANNLKPVPYVIERTRPGQELIFIGVDHSTNPEHEQFPRLIEEWTKFAATGDKAHKIAMVEGNANWPLAASADEAIRQHGESSLLTLLAHEAGIELVSPEPDRKAEADTLAALSSQDDVLLYYFLRQIPQWHREGQKGDVQVYLDNTLSRYQQALGWEIDFTYEHMAAIYRDQLGEELDPMNGRRAHDLSGPTQELSSVNEVARASNRYRDVHIAKEVQRHWQDGKSIFAAYGSAHSYTLEPVLAEL